MISLLVFGFTTAAEGFLADARRFGGGESPLAIALAGIAAADCLRFVAAIANGAIWTRLVAPGCKDTGLQERQAALTALDGKAVRLRRRRIANMNT